MKHVDLVNVKQGTASEMRFSNGNTLPLIARPFGMNSFTIQNDGSSDWFYHPSKNYIEGIRLTHQFSPWLNDYGTLIFMPQKDNPQLDVREIWSCQQESEEVLTPSYMKLRLNRPRCVFELTPTDRGAVINLNFDEEDGNWLSILPHIEKGEYTALASGDTLRVAVTNVIRDNCTGFKMYCVLKFQTGTVDFNQSSFSPDGALVKINGKTTSLSLATSYISYEQAELNLSREIGSKTFHEVKAESDAVWEDYLSRITIETDDEEQLKTFYSCVYRTFLFPRKYYEIDACGSPLHFSPTDGTIKSGVRYGDVCFWDVSRTTFPLFSLIAKDEYREMCEGFINDYTESGWLPRCLTMSERGCMPSTLIDAVLCDATLKGIIDKTLAEKALQGMIKHATTNAPCNAFGRSGAESYCRLGFVPIEAVPKAAVNLTLDAAYGDWCISEMAKFLGHDDIAKEYEKRSKNYKNLFDKESGFMRGKYADGTFRKDFNPYDWGGDYTEGSAWQNSYFVPHDIEGLAELFGGKTEFLKRIDQLFAAPPIFNLGHYTHETHEMAEMAAANFGQCAISNQPSFHIPYIYSALGETEKTAFWCEKICKEAFSSGVYGFPGDEDTGSMAAWYIFSTLGFYPFKVGNNNFVPTKPLVKSFKILGKDWAL